jgi:hypothetical protein
VASVSKIPIQPTVRKAAKRGKEQLSALAIAKPSYRRGREGRKVRRKSEFPIAFAPFAPVAVNFFGQLLFASKQSALSIQTVSQKGLKATRNAGHWEQIR